jgi:hypothetical protein
MIKIEIDNKYTIIEDIENGTFKALRYGKEWRNLVGDNLIFALTYLVDDLQQENQHYKQALEEIVKLLDDLRSSEIHDFPILVRGIIDRTLK